MWDAMQEKAIDCCRFFVRVITLLHLPAYCSFRMTYIWRSFVAQRIAAVNGSPMLFHKATV